MSAITQAFASLRCATPDSASLPFAPPFQCGVATADAAGEAVKLTTPHRPSTSGSCSNRTFPAKRHPLDAYHRQPLPSNKFRVNARLMKRSLSYRYHTYAAQRTLGGTCRIGMMTEHVGQCRCIVFETQNVDNMLLCGSGFRWWTVLCLGT